MAEREIKAVEMVRRIRDAHWEEIKDMSTEDRIAHYRERGRRAMERLHRKKPNEIAEKDRAI
jgi:hypothetical protein